MNEFIRQGLESSFLGDALKISAEEQEQFLKQYGGDTNDKDTVLGKVTSFEFALVMQIEKHMHCYNTATLNAIRHQSAQELYAPVVSMAIVESLYSVLFNLLQIRLGVWDDQLEMGIRKDAYLIDMSSTLARDSYKIILSQIKKEQHLDKTQIAIGIAKEAQKVY